MGSSIKGLLASSKTHPLVPKLHGINDNIVKKMVNKPIPNIP